MINIESAMTDWVWAVKCPLCGSAIGGIMKLFYETAVKPKYETRDVRDFYEHGGLVLSPKKYLKEIEHERIRKEV